MAGNDGKRLPRTVIVLGLVSLLNDAASEMITPLLPLFLTLQLGAGPAIVGLIEGLAETTSSLLKLWSGRLADRGVPAKGLVLGGYLLSNSARPLIGLATGWGMVLGLRFGDRLGKGLRTSPRDALISAAVPSAIRGRAFGFHRSLDHLGAMIGPLLAFLLLAGGMEMGEVFLCSVVPGILVVTLLALGLPPAPRVRPEAPPPLRWRPLDRRLRGLLLAAAALAFATLPEALVILWAGQQGVAVAWIPLLWALAHAVKSLLAFAAGALSDSLGRLPVVVAGWLLRVAVLAAMALAPPHFLTAVLLFLAYAGGLAATEGAERAFIGDLAPPALKATAFGLYHLLVGLLALPGGLLFGLLWQQWGMEPAFLASALLTAGAATTLLLLTRAQPRAGRQA
ncbi:MAG: MFS transporter [Gammaproteobacteria bacterium]|nr:MAG: MFS transporter [Gammaproteobacteria bacterium]